MIFATAIAIALLVTVSNAPDVFWQRLDTVWNNSDAPQNENAALARASEDDRLDVLTRSIQYTLEHPIFGLGLGNFANVNGAELNKPDAWMGAHNTFTQISSEAGVPALLVFVALLATAVRNTKRISQAIPKDPEEAGLSLMARATVASLLSFTFGAFFAHLAYEYFFFYPVAIAAGIRHIARTGAISPAIPVDPCIADLHMSDAR